MAHTVTPSASALEPVEAHARQRPSAEEDIVLVALPPEEREYLLRIAERGNIKKFLSALAEIEGRLEERYAPTLHTLQQFAEAFQVDEIIHVLSPNRSA